MPVIIKNLDDEQAIIEMVDSGIQREEVLPSEKAAAYKMKLEAIKRQGARTDLNQDGGRSEEGKKKEAADVVGEAVGESGRTIQRYIRLTELIPELQKTVDNGAMGITPAEQISYLKPEEQSMLVMTMSRPPLRFPGQADAGNERGRYADRGQYENALGHAYQSVLVREANCETEGKLLEICIRCGDVKTTSTPKSEHRYKTYTIKATCVNPGYTVKECEVCGERQITDITNALSHNYVAHTTAPTCTAGGQTVYRCDGSFTGDHSEALGHDHKPVVTEPTCTEGGYMGVC